MPVDPDFEELFAVSNAEGAESLLVGGYALVVHAAPEAWPARAETRYGGEAVHVIGRRHLLEREGPG